MTHTPAVFTVLGADGFVGRHLVRHLRRRGHACLAPERHDPLPLDRPLGHVVYCIGLTNDYADRPFDTVEAHVSLFARLLREGDFESLVYLSSTRLYDGAEGPGTEDRALALSPRNPRHLYDLSKALGESLGLNCGRPDVRVARLACVYADDLAAENFLHRLLRQALNEPSIVLDSHPASARDYVHVDDVCEALLAIATHGRAPIYNVASGMNLANHELFRLVEDATGCSITARPTCGPGQASPPVDVSAMRDELSLVPRTPAEAIPEIVKRARNRTCSTAVS